MKWNSLNSSQLYPKLWLSLIMKERYFQVNILQEFTASKMKDFLFEYRQGKINRFSKSEPLPQPYIASVKKVVGLNWDDEVSNN